MGKARSHKGGMQHAGQLDIVDILAFAHQQACIFQAGDGGSKIASAHVRSALLAADVQRRLHDAFIAGAAADVARDRDPDVLLGRRGRGAQIGFECHQHSRGAESALQAMIGCESLLECRQRTGFAKALDSFHDGAVDLNRQHEARSHRRAVHDHGACAADAVLATKMRAGQPERVPQKIAEMGARIDLGLAPFAVERECQGIVLSWRPLQRGAGVFQCPADEHAGEMAPVAGRHVDIFHCVACAGCSNDGLDVETVDVLAE